MEGVNNRMINNMETRKIMSSQDSNVAVHFVNKAGYHKLVPYDPPEKYPEYRGKTVDPGNHIYAAVRDTLILSGLDRGNAGRPEWNPFGRMIRPGMTVFIKPNTVSHENLAGLDLFSVIVHASILRPILDYVCLALEGRGRIIVGDSQVIYGEFEPAMQRSGIEDLLRWYRQQVPVPIECFDLRMVRGVRSWMYGRWARKKVEQDPHGYQVVDLGDQSYFRDIDPRRLRIAIANYKNMYKYHSGGHHQYVIPRSFLESQVVINLPKLKTHRRTAVTLALKNYMGIPALKDCLPHFITGSPEEGGDQYIHPCKRKEICLWLHDQIQSNPYMPIKFLFAVIKKMIWNSSKIVPFPDDIYEAMWSGNDTLWRTILDLNRIVGYANREGVVCDTPQRIQFHLIDGIIGGQGEGPLSPEPVKSNVLLAGENAACMDAVGATLMGFDLNRIPLIYRAFQDAAHSRPVCTVTPEEITVNVDGRVLSLATLAERYNMRFAAHPKWVGCIELPERRQKTVVEQAPV